MESKISSGKEGNSEDALLGGRTIRGGKRGLASALVWLYIALAATSLVESSLNSSSTNSIGGQHKQQFPVQAGQQAKSSEQFGDNFKPNEPSPSINLIPVDQPIGAASSPSLPAVALEQDPSFDSAAAGETVSELPAEIAGDEFAQQQQQQLEQVPEYQQSPLIESGPGSFQAAIQQVEGDYATRYLQKQHQHQQMVERRFGLFKGKQQQQQQFGAPMSAQYSAGGYMTNCERCLADLGQQQLAELQQQIEPVPPPPAPPAIAVHPINVPAAPQPFGPLKNKLFMKFPFLMKPISALPQSADSAYVQHEPLIATTPYWQQPNYQHLHHHHHQPQATRAQLAFISRPPPAYNCIQAAASPPLIAASSSQEHVSTQLGKARDATKQYQQQQQQQQTTYSSSSY